MADTRKLGKRGFRGHPRSRTEPALPAWKAFIVQFSRETGAEAGTYSGRIEHLGTGQQAHFESAEELLAFVDAVLEDAGTRNRGGAKAPQ